MYASGFLHAEGMRKPLYLRTLHGKLLQEMRADHPPLMVLVTVHLQLCACT